MTQRLLDVLVGLVEKSFPGEPVYVGQTPSGFARPSSLVVLEDGWEVDVGYSTGSVELRPKYTLTTFSEVDEYHHCCLSELNRRQMRLIELLLPGFVRVGDRAAKIVKPLKLANLIDSASVTAATVTAVFSLTLSRRQFMEMSEKDAPLMEHLILREEKSE